MIESVNNERIKEYAKLSEKKHRDTSKLFLVEGHHLVSEALKKNIVKEIFLLEGETNWYKEVTYVTENVLKKLSDLKTPAKVIAVCHRVLSDKLIGNVLLLDDIADPGNLGTIIRTAAAFNYETIILSPGSVDAYNSKVIRATEGMLFNVNLIVADLESVINRLKKDDYLILASSPKASNIASKVRGRHGLIIGSEARGIKTEISRLADQILRIPMSDNCESLNAGVAAGILMYELNK